MTEVSDTTYNPIVTLYAAHEFTRVRDAVRTVRGTAGTSLAGSCTAYDLIVLDEIVSQCGKTYRGAALARAYLDGRE